MLTALLLLFPKDVPLLSTLVKMILVEVATSSPRPLVTLVIVGLAVSLVVRIAFYIA
jgi:hypothetical protein